jgi:hypothetical protein
MASLVSVDNNKTAPLFLEGVKECAQLIIEKVKSTVQKIELFPTYAKIEKILNYVELITFIMPIGPLARLILAIIQLIHASFLKLACNDNRGEELVNHCLSNICRAVFANFYFGLGAIFLFVFYDQKYRFQYPDENCNLKNMQEIFSD